MTKKPSEQLEALATILKNDIINKCVSPENWTVKQVDDFQLRLTRRTPPCEGLDVYVGITPEHRYMDVNFLKSSEEKIMGTVVNHLAKKSGINVIGAMKEKTGETEEKIISSLIDTGIKELEKKVADNPKVQGMVTPSALANLKKQILENIERKKIKEGEHDNAI